MVVRELVARGLPVKACARSIEKLEELRRELPAIEIASGDVADPASVERAADGCGLLITTVGPYTKFGDVAADAALAQAIPYIDITGEPAWLARLFGEYHAPALEREVAMLPAFGYDYVPGNLAAALALERFGEQAVRIDVAYCLAGKNPRSTKSFSKGTLDSLEASSGARRFGFSGGELREVEGPRRKLEFALDGNAITAAAIGGSEIYTLPRLAPWLDEINVGLAWFEPGQKRETEPANETEGPSEEQRAKARARIVTVARDANGDSLGELELSGPNPYDMSGLLCGWAAEQILGGHALPGGVLGPIEAFGLAQLSAGCTEIGLVEV